MNLMSDHDAALYLDTKARLRRPEPSDILASLNCHLPAALCRSSSESRLIARGAFPHPSSQFSSVRLSLRNGGGRRTFPLISFAPSQMSLVSSSQNSKFSSISP